MPRRVVHQGQVALPLTGTELHTTLKEVVGSKDFFSDAPAKKRAPKKFSPKDQRSFLAAVADARERVENKSSPNAWEGSTHLTILGLYGVLHENCYGFLPEELADRWLIAAKKVQGWITQHFGSDPSKVIPFLRWRLAKEKRLRADNPDRERLIWEWVFNSRTVMDYKAARGKK